jgi:CO/xanthine dehydrogenase FAD-binding subunit
MADFEYVRPQHLMEALECLDAHGSKTKILAGGTDLVIDLRGGSINPRYVLDVSRLPELKGIVLSGDTITVGAAVTLAEIESSEVLQAHAPALQQSALTFASRQIRNVATIGGNVAHCSPCGDTIPPLVVHDAWAVIASRQGRREVPVEHIASGAYACALPPHEIILHFKLKAAGSATFAAFQKIGRRKGLAIARINMAALARQEPDGRIDFIKLALGSCTPTPARMPEVEAFLTGRPPSVERIWEAGRMLAERTIAITGRRPSTVYKEAAIQGLLTRMLYPLARPQP